MAAKKFVSTGYKPAGSVYIAPPSGGGSDISSFYVIQIDTDGVPYYTAF